MLPIYPKRSLTGANGESSPASQVTAPDFPSPTSAVPSDLPDWSALFSLPLSWSPPTPFPGPRYIPPSSQPQPPPLPDQPQRGTQLRPSVVRDGMGVKYMMKVTDPASFKQSVAGVKKRQTNSRHDKGDGFLSGSWCVLSRASSNRETYCQMSMAS